ncbi:chalcone isomerase family protein [Nitrospirota bacterium]
MRINLFILATCLILILMAAPSFAMEIAGVKIPDSVSIGKEPLVLNGAGIRKKFVVKVYVGGLYLPRKEHNAERAIAANVPKRIQMDFLYKMVSREKMVKTWVTGFEDNLPIDSLEPLVDRIQIFCAMFEDARRGDTYIFDYMPGKGTYVFLNNDLKGVIKGHDFNQGLMRIWLGEHPADSGLKEGMLGL